MKPGPKKGKVFMQDKDKLLKLANTITSGKELDIRQKIDRSKASASFIDMPSQQSSAGKSRKGGAPASEKLRAVKKLLVARKTRQKREKARARKGKDHGFNKDAGSNGNGVLDNHASASRKRVSFAD